MLSQPFPCSKALAIIFPFSSSFLYLTKTFKDTSLEILGTYRSSRSIFLFLRRNIENKNLRRTARKNIGTDKETYKQIQNVPRLKALYTFRSLKSFVYLPLTKELCIHSTTKKLFILSTHWKVSNTFSSPKSFVYLQLTKKLRIPSAH